MIKKLLTPLFFLSFTKEVAAHCPLCTIGVAAAAGGAAYLGVNSIVIGLFAGAFSISLGWWISKMIKKKYIPFQRALIILGTYLSIVLPLISLIKGSFPYYLSLIGDYGSLFNRTYLINKFLLGGILGGLVVCSTPWLSKKISSLRGGKILPFQGTLLTLIFLIILALIIQFYI